MKRFSPATSLVDIAHASSPLSTSAAEPMVMVVRFVFSKESKSLRGASLGAKLGQIFDDTYVLRVSKETAGLFDGMDRLLRSLALAGHPPGALSNACGAYVRAVMTANELDESPGQRIGLFRVALGADEVPKAKPAADGLLECCEKLGVTPAASVYVGDSPSDGKAASAAGMRSVGVLWGANGKAALEDHFDVLVEDVPSLTRALRDLLLTKEAKP